MDLGWSSYEAATEYMNYHACMEAFTEAHPTRHPDEAEMCDDCSHRCPNCPFDLDFAR